MPDRWGRPTFEDGFNLMRGLNYAKEMQYKDEQRKVDQDSYLALDSLMKDKDKADLSAFNPKAQKLARDMYWQQSVNDLDKQIREQQLSKEGVQLRFEELKTGLAEASGKLKAYKAARAAGDDKTAYTIAQDLYNNHMYTGNRIDQNDDGSAVMTNWDQSTKKMDRPPLEDVDQQLGAYFSMPAEQIMQMSLQGDENRQALNLKIFGQAEQVVNPKTGEVAWRVPAGTWGKDGKPRGTFFIKDPQTQEELASEESQGFVTVDQYNKMAENERLKLKDDRDYKTETEKNRIAAEEAKTNRFTSQINALHDTAPEISEYGETRPQTEEEKAVHGMVAGSLGYEPPPPFDPTTATLPPTWDWNKKGLKTSEIVGALQTQYPELTPQQAADQARRLIGEQKLGSEKTLKSAHKSTTTGGLRSQGKKAEAAPAAPKGEAALPDDIANWDVTMVKKGNKKVPVVVTEEGPVYLTQEQYDQWRKAQEAAKPTGLRAPTRVDNVPRTMPRMY